MDHNNVRIRCIGRPVSGTSRLPRRILREMDKSIEQTKGNDGLNFTLAFDYGGRSWSTRPNGSSTTTAGPASP